MNKEFQYQVFDWLRFPLIVGVVFIHCFGEPFHYDAIDFAHLTSVDFYNLFRVSISQVATHVCVPLFFFISGYLFFNGLATWNKEVYYLKLRKRIKTLLVPFLIWNTVYVLISVVGKYVHGGSPAVSTFFSENGYLHLYWDSHVWNVDRTNWWGGVIPASSPKLVPLWYLRDLMVVMVFSPVVNYWLQFTKYWGLLFLGVCYITGVGIGIPGFSMTAFFFFGTGAYFNLTGMDATAFSYKHKHIIYALTILLWIVCTAYNGHNTKTGDYFYPFFVIIGCISVFNIVTTIVRKGNCLFSPFLSRSSFFIYLAHTIFFIKISKKCVGFILDSTNPLLMTLGYLCVPILTVCLCLVSYYLFNKFLPRLCAVLTGER